MTAPIVTQVERTPIDLKHPTVNGYVDGDAIVRYAFTWPSGQLWERLEEARND